MARRRLRIPQALAVVLVSSSATVAIAVFGCSDAGDGITPTDAPQAVVDPVVDPNDDTNVVDAAVDARRPDARPDARPRDAYVPPDTPVV